jgi:hypothetical protein
MPTFLSDPPPIVYILLGGLLVITGAIAAQKQDRRAAIPFGIAALLLLVVFLIDRLFESPREEAVRRVYLMQIAADTKNPDVFVEQVADKVNFQTAQGQTKTVTREELKNSGFWSMLRQLNIHVAVWDFSRNDVKDFGNGTIEIGFMAKGELPDHNQQMIYVRTTFTRQSDGSFKLTAFRSFHPTNHDEVFPIPNFP